MKRRATITFTDEALARIQTSAANAGLSLPDYIRRALGLAETVDKYTNADGVLTVVDESGDKAQVVHIVSF